MRARAGCPPPRQRRRREPAAARRLSIASTHRSRNDRHLLAAEADGIGLAGAPPVPPPAAPPPVPAPGGGALPASRGLQPAARVAARTSADAQTAVVIRMTELPIFVEGLCALAGGVPTSPLLGGAMHRFVECPLPPRGVALSRLTSRKEHVDEWIDQA